jgi:hypothetical protein
MCTCELLVNILIMFNCTKTFMNIEIVRLEIYPAEGPILKALVAPCALVDVVRCSVLRTTVDVGRCLQCSPSNVHQEEDGVIDGLCSE